jgi:hypothetical protein
MRWAQKRSERCTIFSEAELPGEKNFPKVK